MSDFRIYAACLASYNNGRLHGVWIDADQDEDTINAEINAMLKASPCPNVIRADWTCTGCGHDWTRDVSSYQAPPTSCPACESAAIERGEPYPSAEEFAIHDHEGFGNLLGEYSPIGEVVLLAEAIGEHGDKYRAIRSYGYDHDEAIEACEDAYHGEYDSFKAFVEEYADDSGLFHGVPDDSPLRYHFSYDSYAHDLEVSGEYITIELNGRVHIFSAR